MDYDTKNHLQSTVLRIQVTGMAFMEYAITLPPGGYLGRFCELGPMRSKITPIMAEQLLVQVTGGRLLVSVTV